MDVKGIDGATLASGAGLTPTAVSYYRNGKRMPGASELFAMAKALGVSMDSLMGEDVESEKFEGAAVWRNRAQSAEQKLAALKAAVKTLLERY